MSEAAAPARASLSDWLAVAAGMLGALMAMVDISIVNASLPTIQGEIGATPSEGTWIGTSYLVAEIVVIPLTAWLERLLGMRRLLLISATGFTLFSVACGFSASLEAMIFGRLGQGFAGGILIPTGLTIIARRLPPAQQPIGLAIVAVTALLGPAAGPLIGGWLTENLSWHYAFFMNVPICAVQIAMLIIAIPAGGGDRHELRKADWAGVIGMILGLGAFTTLLEEGHREQWFESTFIWQLAVTSAFGVGLIVWGQLHAERPVIRLSLLRNASLASAVALMTVVGMLIYGCLFITPQFLAAIAGYNALQAGQVAFLSGSISIPVALCYPALAARLDPRVIVAMAMLMIALAAFLASGLTGQSTGSDFTATQLLFGAGTSLSAIPLQQAVLSSVSMDDSAEANGLMSVARNLGGSIGLAAIASFSDQRLELHHWQLNAAMVANDPEMQRQVADTAAMFGGGGEALEAALRSIDAQVIFQALVMTFNDMFLALALICAAVTPLVIFLRPVKAGAPAMAVH